MRRWSGAITLAVLLAVFVAGTAVGVKLLVAKAPPLVKSKDTSTAACVPRTIQSGGKLGANQVTVNVFNASTTSGLANRTLINLQTHGFRPGTVANAPKGVSATNVTILTTDKTAPNVRLVAAQFKGKLHFAAPPVALPSGIEVVVGSQYVGLRKKFLTTTTATKATRVCIQMEPQTS